MLPPIDIYVSQSLLEELASGPFSFICLGYYDPLRTAYPLPDGSWNWADCPATDWTPALSSYPGPENI